MKSLPNYISLSRIILSFTLLFLKPLSLTFYIVYLICGFSDMIDGFVARRTGTTSRLGERLDSAADMVMAGVLLIVLYPVITPPTVFVIWVVLIGLIRVASLLLAVMKYKTFAVLHTYGNKAAGMVLFLFPILLSVIPSTWLMYAACIVAGLSALEEFIIHLTSRQLQVNRKSIFMN